MLSTRPLRSAAWRAPQIFCIVVVSLACGVLAIRVRAEDAPARFLLNLQPTEGAVISLLGSANPKTDRGWQLDPMASSGLDHVDVVDVGEQPKRLAPPAPGAGPKERATALFQGPRLWAVGIRATSPGHARVVLRMNDGGTEQREKLIEVDVVKETTKALVELPLGLGENVLLEIWSNPSTGAKWRINAAESSGLDHVKVAAGRSYDPSDPTDWRRRNLVGAPDLQEWRVEPLSPGTAHVTLDYGPPWEKETLYRQLSIDATISAPR